MLYNSVGDWRGGKGVIEYRRRIIRRSARDLSKKGNPGGRGEMANFPVLPFP